MHEKGLGLELRQNRISLPFITKRVSLAVPIVYFEKICIVGTPLDRFNTRFNQGLRNWFLVGELDAMCMYLWFSLSNKHKKPLLLK